MLYSNANPRDAEKRFMVLVFYSVCEYTQMLLTRMDYAALQNEWRTNPEYDVQGLTKILAEAPKSSLVWALENPQAVLLLRYKGFGE